MAKESAPTPYKIERPHATDFMLQRQGSCRGFSTINQSSPFKRQLSLRLNELPSNLERKSQPNTPTGSDNPAGPQEEGNHVKGQFPKLFTTYRKPLPQAFSAFSDFFIFQKVSIRLFVLGISRF